jgi:outer membrane protein
MKFRLFPILLTLPLAFPVPAARAIDLLGIYELALRYDPKLHAAEAQRNAALENKPQAIAQLLPTLSAQTGLSRQAVQTADSPFLTFNLRRNVGFWQATGTVSLLQPIYHYELWVQLSQADNTIAEAEALYAAEQQNIILRVTQAYFDVLYNLAAVRFAKAELESIKREREQAKARFEAGLAAITDLDEAQAAYDRARAGIIIAENDLNNAREALRQIVGEDPGELEPLQTEIELQAPVPDDLEQWNESAQRNGLTIIAATNRAEKAKKEIDLQFAGHYPSIDLVANASFFDNNRPPFPNRFQQQDIGMQINVPIFEGGGVNSRVKQARFNFESASQRVDEERRAIRTRVKNTFRAILSAMGEAQAFASAIRSSQRALEAAQAGMEVGTRTMTDVLFVQRQYYQNLRDHARSIRDYIVNSIGLKEAASVLRREDLERINLWLQPVSVPGPASQNSRDRQSGERQRKSQPR